MLFTSHSVSSDSLCVSCKVQLLPHWFSLCQCYRPTTSNTHSFFLLFLTHPLIHSVIKMCFECIKKEHRSAKTRMYNIVCFATLSLCLSVERLPYNLTRQHLNIRICICDPLQVHPIRQHTVLLVSIHTCTRKEKKTGEKSGRQVDRSDQTHRTSKLGNQAFLNINVAVQPEFHFILIFSDNLHKHNNFIS